MIEFAGGVLPNLTAGAEVAAMAGANGAEIITARAEPSPSGDAWRAVIDARRPSDRPTDLRCFLALEGAALTETWSYLWT